MNEANYASLEASKRLVDAGIVLETDFYWREYNPKTVASLIDARKMAPQPYLINKDSRCKNSKWEYPAPSMAEVWRELPECIPYDDTTWAAWQAHKQGDLTIISIAAFRKEFISLNPTDALISLLIWQRKEANHDRD